MVSNVNDRSPREFGDLPEGISLEEEKLNGLPLLGGEPGIESFRQLLAEDTFERQLVKQRLLPVISQTECRVIQFLGCIKMAGGEIPAPIEGTVVGNLEDPGTCRAARDIEQRGFTEVCVRLTPSFFDPKYVVNCLHD